MLQPTPPSEPAVLPRLHTARRWVIIGGVAALLAIGAAIGVWQWGFGGTEPVAAPSVKFGFEDGRQRWSPLWGQDKVNYQVTSAAAFEGKNSLQVTTITAGSDEAKSIGVTHGLDGLRPGVRVTFHLRVPGEQMASVRFFARNSDFEAIWAPETEIGNEAALPTDTNWKEYVWTVPEVDKVQAIGMEIYQWTDDPVIVWIDAVNW